MQSKNPAQMSREEMIAALRKQPKSVVNNITTGIALPESYDEASGSKKMHGHPIRIESGSYFRN